MIKVFKFLICIYSVIALSFADSPDDTESVFILLFGEGDSRCWWTVAEVRQPQISEAGIYDGGATLNIVISNFFPSKTVIVDADNLPYLENGSVELKGPSLPATVEALESAINARFKSRPGEKVAFRVPLPIEATNQVKVSSFIRDAPVLAVGFEREHSLDALRHLSFSIQKNSEAVLGKRGPDLPMEHLGSGNSLAKFWEKKLLRDVAVEVVYSEVLGALFFRIPDDNRDAFYELCEGAFSGRMTEREK